MIQNGTLHHTFDAKFSCLREFFYIKEILHGAFGAKFSSRNPLMQGSPGGILHHSFYIKIFHNSEWNLRRAFGIKFSWRDVSPWIMIDPYI